jgi:hypothetical protein
MSANGVIKMDKDSHNVYVAFVNFPRMFVIRADNPAQARNKILTHTCNIKNGDDSPYYKDIVEDKEYSDLPEISDLDTMDIYAGDDAEKQIQEYFKHK